MTEMLFGLESFLKRPRAFVGKGRVGLVVNPTSVDRRLHHAVDLMHEHPQVHLTTLFGPEHGIRSDAQDMIHVAESHDRITGLPEISLYGTTFASLSPTAEHLNNIDVLVIDIQDVGSRYYTYAATMALCMKACGQQDVKVIVLDRPNPLNGITIEGGGLTPGLENFCALYAVPQRHGMTMGELARLYQTSFGIQCELEVVPCEGWLRHHYYDQTSLPWVMPSPNMPTLDTAIVYPGMCLLEGTNISEGRGTCRPFELVGAPFIDGHALAAELLQYDLEGVIFRPVTFEPTFHKCAKQRCGGIQLHVTHRASFCAYRTGLAIVCAIKKRWPNDFAWRTDTYEFRSDVPAIDLLTGFAEVRTLIDSCATFATIMDVATQGTQTYDAGRNAVLLY